MLVVSARVNSYLTLEGDTLSLNENTLGVGAAKVLEYKSHKVNEFMV